MTTLTLYYHPLSSYCHKVLIALDVLGVEAELLMLNPGDPAQRAAHAARWPTAKIPLLVDAGRAVPETSLQIEHLQLHNAPPGRTLIPPDADAALEVRLWDRMFDQYVMTPMNVFTDDLLRPQDQRDPFGVARAREQLLAIYATIDAHLQGRTWVCGEAFSMADCAAAPALFYAVAYVPVPPQHAALAAYFDRLMAHPAVARVVDQARPWLQYFPGRAGLAARFTQPAAA
jgi:glutathione S-transferase